MSELIDVHVPDIGDASDVEVIEILVSVGDAVELEASLITLESDKATMEIPSPVSGQVREIMVKLGDKVSEGDIILRLESEVVPSQSESESEAESASESESDTDESPSQETIKPEPSPPTPPKSQPEETQDSSAENDPISNMSAPSRSSPTAHINETGFKKAHASPSVRRFARELGADVSLITGSGPKGRILKEDVQAFVKQALSGVGVAGGQGKGAAAAGGAGIPPIPAIDFSQFGPVERIELSRIKKLTAKNLHRAWLNIPLVTHHDEADITETEAFRKSLKPEAEARGLRITLLAFIAKALASTLKAYPRFNASLTPEGDGLFLKKYSHIGIAVDTPDGLVVPVIRDVDQKSIYALAEEMADISQRARNKKLKPADMQGGSISISSLGGIGGTAFTPLVNAPEVAILGVTRSKMQPVWNGSEFTPRLMLPLDLSYDHRVIDGAEAARFMAHLCQILADMRRALLDD
ncbi:MAG: dihydrolipoyllysine-residue acetyltransferase [Gammaproteobacteria bacterium]|nr:dihydrolipoyllysine-residue acetyltransferase [Gammaproteobacteria bacterium]